MTSFSNADKQTDRQRDRQRNTERNKITDATDYLIHALATADVGNMGQSGIKTAHSLYNDSKVAIS